MKEPKITVELSVSEFRVLNDIAFATYQGNYRILKKQHEEKVIDVTTGPVRATVKKLEDILKIFAIAAVKDISLQPDLTNELLKTLTNDRNNQE